jgi:hypothetical protein
MDDLVQFLRDRLDEDEMVASAATEGPWSVDNDDYAEAIYGADQSAVIGGGRWGGEASVFESTEDAIHIARHDPARVLREVEAKRRLLDVVLPDVRNGDAMVEDEWGGESNMWWNLLSTLALPYADHPDYRSEWAC